MPSRMSSHPPPSERSPWPGAAASRPNMLSVADVNHESMRAPNSGCRSELCFERRGRNPGETRLRIAIFLESMPETGGGFQQALSTIEALTSGQPTPDEFVVFTPFEQSRRWLSARDIAAVRFRHRPF